MKRGQIQITFNWVYIMIAGAIILLFFIGLVVKQQSTSQDRLATDVVQIVDSIFTSTSVADKTKVFIDISGLADYTFFFSCTDSVTEFGVVNQGLTRQDPTSPIFAPEEIKSRGLVLWSLPYNLPFKVVDFLYVVPSNMKYYIIGSNPFAEEFLNETADADEKLDIKSSAIVSLADVNSGRGTQVRIVDTTGLVVQDGGVIPENVFGEQGTSAVSFTGDSVNFFDNLAGRWRKLGQHPLVTMNDELDAAKYAAVFSGNDEIYGCNMKKSFKRLQYVAEVHAAKVQEIERNYAILGGSCNVLLSGSDTIGSQVLSLQAQATSCTLYSESCRSLPVTAQKLREANQKMRRGSCTTLY